MSDSLHDPALSDEELARQARAGAARAFEALARRWQTRLAHYLERRVGRGPTAEDLTQETFLKAYRQLDRYDTRWRFSTWLFTIARRLALDFQRRERRVEPVFDAAACIDPAIGAENAVLAKEAREEIWAIARRVTTEEQFTALWLRYVEDTPLSEIAEAMGKSLGAIKMLLARAREILAPRLASFDESNRGRPGLEPIERAA